MDGRSRLRRNTALPLIGAALVGLGLLSGCSGAPTSGVPGGKAAPPLSKCGQGQGDLPWAKFTQDTGLAFGAFHQLVYVPYKAGNPPPQVANRAGQAALFTANELKRAQLWGNRMPEVCNLKARFEKASADIRNAADSIKSGQATSQQIEALHNRLNALQYDANTGLAKIRGGRSQLLAPVITEQLPSDAQLTAGQS